MWLLDDLKKDFLNARVLTYGYDSRLEESNSFQTLEDLANAFIESLLCVRDQNPVSTCDQLLCNEAKVKQSANQGPKPIIFLAHSLGGLILKKALIQMSKSTSPQSHNMSLLATCGIVFFGVPNQGLNTSFVRAIVRNQANEDFIHDLRPSSPLLSEMRRDFSGAFPFRDSTIVCVYETKKSPSAQKVRHQFGNI